MREYRKRIYRVERGVSGGQRRVQTINREVNPFNMVPAPINRTGIVIKSIPVALGRQVTNDAGKATTPIGDTRARRM